MQIDRNSQTINTEQQNFGVATADFSVFSYGMAINFVCCSIAILILDSSSSLQLPTILLSAGLSCVAIGSAHLIYNYCGQVRSIERAIRIRSEESGF